MAVALAVALLLSPLLFSSPHKDFRQRFHEFFNLPLYCIWLLREILKANFHILRLAFHPDLESQINPRIFSVQCPSLTYDFSRYVMGMSITIVAGTVTVRIQDDYFTVHAISDYAAAGVPEPMQAHIANVFEQPRGSV